jgi:GSH-dependent disulfide-bond oxidoreductase
VFELLGRLLTGRIIAWSSSIQWILIRKDHIDSGCYKTPADFKGMKFAMNAPGVSNTATLNAILKAHIFKEDSSNALCPFANLSSDTMTDTAYPPEVWVWQKGDSPKWRYSNTNRPIAGATHEKELPRGKHPLQLYSQATPNGVKVTIMLEELLAAGHSGAEYDAWLIRIGEGDQFGSGFVGVNPNSKIPAVMDYSEQTPRRVFESGAILFYLADKFGAFLPKDRGKRTEALNWLFWQMGSTPYVGGGFGHFYAYAPVKIKYAIDRFAMEVKRQLDVLDRQLADNQFVAGDEYTIADMAIWPWYGNGMLNGASYNDPRKFLQTHEYKNLTRWTKEIGERPAVRRGRMVNRASGPPEGQLRERHDASDFETKTQDKIDAAGNPSHPS